MLLDRERRGERKGEGEKCRCEREKSIGCFRIPRLGVLCALTRNRTTAFWLRDDALTSGATLARADFRRFNFSDAHLSFSLRPQTVCRVAAPSLLAPVSGVFCGQSLCCKGLRRVSCPQLPRRPLLARMLQTRSGLFSVVQGAVGTWAATLSSWGLLHPEGAAGM